VALSGLQAGSCDSLGSESAPGTPRRRLSIAAGARGQVKFQDMFGLHLCGVQSGSAQHAMPMDGMIA
jgi:hypothetical protein